MSAMSSLPCPPHVCSSVTSHLHLHVWNLLLITPCNGCQSLCVRSRSCYFSYVGFMYLLNIAQLWVRGGDASGECLLFVVTDQRRPSCAMCCWGWSSASQLGCCLLCDCVKPIDASELLPVPSLPLHSPCCHVPATRGWASGQLLRRREWVKLQISPNKRHVKNTFSLQSDFFNHLCFFHLLVSGFHCQKISSRRKVE